MARRCVALVLLLLAAACSARPDVPAQFGADSPQALVIAAARSEPLDYDNYVISWQLYDPDSGKAVRWFRPAKFRLADAAAPGEGGADRGAAPASCQQIDGYRYCLFAVPAGHYCMVDVQTWRRGRAVDGSGRIWTARTQFDLAVDARGFYGIDYGTRVSEVPTQRFILEPGRVYFVGAYGLDGLGAVVAHDFALAGARKLLAGHAGLEGEPEPVAFAAPYSLQFRHRFTATGPE